MWNVADLKSSVCILYLQDNGANARYISKYPPIKINS